MRANLYRIEPSAKQLETTIFQLARSALNHGIRVPLNIKYGIGADQSRLAGVCASLSSGESLEAVRRKHNVGEWVLTRVLLDSPELFRKYTDERKTAKLRAHRRTLSEALAIGPSITREEFRKQHPAAYEYLTKHDPLQWRQQIQKTKGRWTSPASGDQRKDRELVKRASKALDDLKKMKRPVRISRCSLLTRAGIKLSLIPKIDRYPLTQKFVADNCESRQEFRGRKISWAVAAMAAEGVSISVNTLRRRAGMHPKLLRSFAHLVRQSAKQQGAQIQNGSFFAVSRV